jgi:AcrR family transcriptional regulator
MSQDSPPGAQVVDPTKSERGPFDLPARPDKPRALARLPVARHVMPREFVEANQRNRLMAGAVRAVAERGYAGTGVETICQASGLSRTTFYARFADKEACFLAAYDIAVAWLHARAAAAVDRVDGWREGVRAATETTLALLAADPALARLVSAEILCAGSCGQVRRQALIGALIPLLRRGRAEDPLGPELSPTLEFALLGGTISLIGREVGAGRAARLGELAPDLVELLLAPYLGTATATRAAGGRD